MREERVKMASKTIHADRVRFLVGVPVLTGYLASCIVTMAPPQAPSAPPSPPVEASQSAAAASPEKTSLALDVRMYVERKGQKQRIEPGGQLHTGDTFEMLIRSNQPAYVYLVQDSSMGEISTLFPSQGDQLLSGEREYRLPADREVWYQVSGADHEENLYLLMARDPIRDMKRLLPHVSSRSSAPPAPARPPAKRSGPRSPDSKPPQVPELQPDRVLSEVTRTVRPVRKAGAVTATLPADASDSDSILVRELHFGRR
jgi:hypothetical protein